MKTTIEITNSELYNEKVIEVDTTSLTGTNGTISIEEEGRGWRDFTGEHGIRDYEEDFGFILKVEI